MSSNTIDANGLSTKTLADIKTDLENAMKSIYGSDINLDSNSPDGQLINIFAQIIRDKLDLVTQVYTSFDPDQAIGRTLDSRCAINGIERQPGTHSTTDITIVTSQAVSLIGLDGNSELQGDEFIVSDNAGTQWVLVNSYDIGSGGSTTLVFQAVELGAILASPNTITTPVTIVQGVTSVNNPATQLTIGEDEETDAAFKIRRLKSVALSSQGFYDGLQAALLNVEGVDSVAIYENTGDSPDGDSIPGHSIWVIVSGTAADADIGAAIYSKRNAGCGMKGSTSVEVTRADGSTFTVNWDVVVSENLYAKFNVDLIAGDVTGITGDVHNGTKIVDNITDTSGLVEGGLLRGSGIPDGNTIATIDSATQVTMANNNTGTHTTTALTGVAVVVADLKQSIEDQFSAGVYETVDINHLATLVQTINPALLVTSAGLSTDGISYGNTKTPSAKNKQFSLVVARITVI